MKSLPCVVDSWAGGGLTPKPKGKVPLRSPGQGNLVNENVILTLF